MREILFAIGISYLAIEGLLIYMSGRPVLFELLAGIILRKKACKMGIHSWSYFKEKYFQKYSDLLLKQSFHRLHDGQKFWMNIRECKRCHKRQGTSDMPGTNMFRGYHNWNHTEGDTIRFEGIEERWERESEERKKKSK